MCAKESLVRTCSNRLCRHAYQADFDLDPTADAVIWVKQVEQPEAFGVVKMNADEITELVEKPAEFVSDLAVIGYITLKKWAI
jgi:glucose-1-phosphate thymidylyltransferase